MIYLLPLEKREKISHNELSTLGRSVLFSAVKSEYGDIFPGNVQSGDICLNDVEELSGNTQSNIRKDCAKGLSEIVRHENGKPYFRDYPQIHFNYSHCRTAVLCGVGRGELGVDIETKRLVGANFTKRFCHRNEAEILEKSEDAAMDLIHLWVMKEAYVKYTGEGLRRKLSELDFSEELMIWKQCEETQISVQSQMLNQASDQMQEFMPEHMAHEMPNFPLKGTASNQPQDCCMNGAKFEKTLILSSLKNRPPALLWREEDLCACAFADCEEDLQLVRMKGITT